MRKLQVTSYKLKILTALIFSLLFKICSAQSSRDTGKYSFSLQQAVDFAMKNQTQMLNASFDEQIAQAKVKETIGIGFPQINGSFDIKYFIDIPTTVLPNFVSPAVYGGLVQAGVAPYDPLKMSPDGYPPLEAKFGTKYQAAAGVDLSQIVFSSDYLVGLQATKTFLELTRKATQRTRIEISVAVSKAYYTVLVNHERMNLIDANIVRIKKLMDDTKALNENGFVEKIDVDRITVAHNNLLVEKEKIQRLLDLTTSLLKFQMGMDQFATLALTDKLADIKLSSEITADKIDYSKRVEYSLMQTQKNILQLQLKRNKMGYLPTMILYGNASASALRNEFDIFDTKKSWYPTVLVGARIGVPIFDGLQKNYRIQQSKIDLLKAENNLKMVQQSIDFELASSKTILQNASASLEIQKKNIELAEEIYKTSKLKYEQGVGSNLEVMNAETSLKEAQTNYFSALFDALVAKVDYDKANGNIK